jgi:Spy/CpxP family protein refolding chaperone
MTKIKKALLVSMGACLLMALPLAHAQSIVADGAPLKGHYGQRIQEIYKQLNLTGDQKQQLEANKQQHRARMEAVRQEIKADKEALKEELMKTAVDMPKITNLHNHLKAALSQMEDDKLSSILAVRTILTPEQFAKFVNLMHQHKQWHEK